MEVTDNHPYWVKDRGWVDAVQLEKGMVLQSLGDGELTVSSLKRADRNEVTYNFTVADFHTYFAGKQKAFVHNCNGFCGAVAGLSKSINLPGWRKVSVDMAHVAERHMEGGAKIAGKSVFVGLNERGVMAAIKQAYGSASTIHVQGERVLLSGVTKTGMAVEMWLNKTTKMIETAYPVVR